MAIDSQMTIIYTHVQSCSQEYIISNDSNNCHYDHHISITFVRIQYLHPELLRPGQQRADTRYAQAALHGGSEDRISAFVKSALLCSLVR